MVCLGFDIRLGAHETPSHYGMKFTDDYQAKLRIWAANPRVMPLPAAPPLPKFKPQKFRNHAEMNRWKESLLRQLARGDTTHG